MNFKEQGNKAVEGEKNKAQQQINSYKEENENLKRQMFKLDKTIRSLESKEVDSQDELARLKETSDSFKRKY